jgi:hypothetical protein
MLAEVVGTDVKVVKNADHGYSEPEQYAEVKRLLGDFIFETL